MLLSVLWVILGAIGARYLYRAWREAAEDLAGVVADPNSDGFTTMLTRQQEREHLVLFLAMLGLAGAGMASLLGLLAGYGVGHPGRRAAIVLLLFVGMGCLTFCGWLKRRHRTRQAEAIRRLEKEAGRMPK